MLTCEIENIQCKMDGTGTNNTHVSREGQENVDGLLTDRLRIQK